MKRYFSQWMKRHVDDIFVKESVKENLRSLDYIWLMTYYEIFDTRVGHHRIRYINISNSFRSRSAFKIMEIQDKYKIIKSNDCVVDLGAAPGYIKYCNHDTFTLLNISKI